MDFTDKIALYDIKKRFNRAGGRRAHLAGLHGVTVVLAAFGLEGLLRAVDQPGRETVKIGCILALCAFSVVIIQYMYQQHIENFNSIARIGAMFCLYGSVIAALVAFGHTVGTAVAMDWSYTVAMGGLAGVVAGIPVGSVYVRFGRAKTVGQQRQMQL